MRKRIVIIGIAGVVAFLAAGFLIPAYRAPRLSRSLVVCESNLRNIQLAKELWRDTAQPTNQPPVPEVLIQKYLGKEIKLVCPRGGEYESGAFDEGPSCTCGRRITADGEMIRP